MQELLRVKSGEVLESGIFPALPGAAPILWADGENIQFASGMVGKTQGFTGLVNLAARPTGMRGHQVPTERRLFLGAGGSYYRYRNSDGLTALKTGLSPGGVWQFAPFGQHVVASNGIDGLRYWNGADALLTTPFTYALSLWKFRRQVFAMNTNIGTNTIFRCDVDDPQDWTPLPLNDASQYDAYDLDGSFLSGQPLGNSMGLYTENSLSIWYYTGGTTFYGLRPGVQGIGALGHYSVVPDGNMNYGIMKNRAFRTDGVNAQDLDVPALREWMKENVNWDRGSEVYGWNDKLNSLIRWILPTGADEFVSVGYSIQNQRWTKFNDNMCIGESAVWPNAFQATPTRLYSVDPLSADKENSALESWVQTKPLDLGLPQRYKTIDKIEMTIETEGTVGVQVGFADKADDDITWNPTTYDAQAEIFLDHDEVREGPYMAFKILSDTVGATWKLSEFAIHGEVTGWIN